VNGTFETSVVIPESATNAGRFEDVSTLSIEAAYEESETNLGHSTASTTVPLTISSPWNWLGAAAIVVVVIIAAIIIQQWWTREQSASVENVTNPTGWQASIGADMSAESLLNRARDVLGEEQPVLAAQLAYAALRTHLEAEDGGDGNQTHWEFYRQCQSRDKETLETLRNATEIYERVVFAADSVSDETAAPLLDQAEQLIDSGSTSGS